MSGNIVFLNPRGTAGEPHEAALSPLEALLVAFGLEAEEERIAEALPYHRDRLELVDVLNAMARMGYTCAPLSIRLRELDPRLLPCAFVEKKTGRLRAITAPSSERTRGTAYIFKRQPKDQREIGDARNADLHGWFFTALQRFRGQIWGVMGVSLVLGFVSLAMPLFLMAIYDRVTDITSTQAIYLLCIGALIALFMDERLRQLRSQSLAWFAARIDNIVSNRVLSRLLQMPAHAIEGASVASQVARLRAFDSLREFFIGPLFLTLLDLPFTLIAFVALAVLAGPVALIPLGLVLGYGALALALRMRLKLAMFDSARERSNAQMNHIELFEKLEALRLTGMSEVWREQFRDFSAQGSLASFRTQYLAQILETAIYALTALAGLAVIYLGVTRVWDGAMTGGALFASLMLFWRVIAPWQTLASNIPRLEQLYRSIQQIDRLMRLETERESAPALGRLTKLHGALTFSKVGLRYSKDTDPVFVGLSFSAEPGELVAVAGANGSGKSTILKLALGLHRPQAGAIYLDGRDIRQLDPIDLRKRIAYVPQFPEFFDGTIAENLRLASPCASDRDLWRALELAGAKSQVEKMPLGLQAPAVQDGEQLRSGLLHQLVLARAYVKDAPLLLIDELSYTMLNSAAGEIFVECLKEWRGRKTVIMISHRDDHIALADKAVGLLEGGLGIVGRPELVVQKLREEAFRGRRRTA